MKNKYFLIILKTDDADLAAGVVSDYSNPVSAAVKILCRPIIRVFIASVCLFVNLVRFLPKLLKLLVSLLRLDLSFVELLNDFLIFFSQET